MTDNTLTRELWRTTPIGRIADQFIAIDPEREDRERAAQAADDFLYDLSADGPVLVLNGETRRLRLIGHQKAGNVWVEVSE